MSSNRSVNVYFFVNFASEKCCDRVEGLIMECFTIYGRTHEWQITLPKLFERLDKATFPLKIELELVRKGSVKLF